MITAKQYSDLRMQEPVLATERTIDLGEQGRPLMVFICDQITVDADGNVLAVRPVPHFRYKLAVLKKDDKTLHVLESSGFRRQAVALPGRMGREKEMTERGPHYTAHIAHYYLERWRLSGCSVLSWWDALTAEGWRCEVPSFTQMKMIHLFHPIPCATVSNA